MSDSKHSAYRAPPPVHCLGGGALRYLGSTPAIPGRGENQMKTKNCRLLTAAGALVLAMAMVPGALAQCGLSSKLLKPSSWQPQMGGAHVVRAPFGRFDDDDDSPSIVGMWHVVFTAKTFNGAAIPNTMIDNALVQWHSDKTEIMNSARPAQDGDFCIGVWAKTGRSTYHLNHFAWLGGSDTANAPSGIGNPPGPTRLVETVTLSEDGNHYSGTFKLDAYDTSNNLAVSPDARISLAWIVLASIAIAAGLTWLSAIPPAHTLLPNDPDPRQFLFGRVNDRTLCGKDCSLGDHQASMENSCGEDCTRPWVLLIRLYSHRSRP
jgi:hypothetical protein